MKKAGFGFYRTINSTTFMKNVISFLCFISIFIFSHTSAQTNEKKEWFDLMSEPGHNFYDIKKAFQQYEIKIRAAKEVAEEKKMKDDDKDVDEDKEHDEENNVESDEKELPGFEIYKRWENFMEPRVYPSGDRTLPTRTYDEFMHYEKQLIRKNGLNQNSNSNRTVLNNSNWTFIGPSVIPSGGGGAGRINFIRFQPGNSSVIYVGAPAGGLWKTSDGGTTWSTNTDFLNVIGLSDLVINPNNTSIMYLATGDGDHYSTHSIGVLKSTDGGLTWNPTGLNFAVSAYVQIRKLLMDPTNDNILYAATTWGVYKTVNAGANWTLILNTNMYDFEINPGNASIIYGASNSTFYTSTNGGTNWSSASTGLPLSANINRLAIAVSAASPGVVYVLASSNNSNYDGLYKSTDNGLTFSTQSTTPNILGYDTGNDTGGQGWYDLSIIVSSSNSNDVYVGGVNHWRSTNGGVTWVQKSHWYGGFSLPYVHADIHALEFLPGSSTTIFSGNDGGLFKSTNSGTSWTDLSSGLAIKEFYRIAWSPTSTNKIMGGTQDNGTDQFNGSWTRIYGGDGMDCMYDFTNALTLYIELYYGAVRKSTNGGSSFINIASYGGSGVNEDGAWVTPMAMSPASSTVIYLGKSQVYKSINGGSTWSTVGSISSGSGKIIALALSAANSNYIYAAKSDRFFTCTDGINFIDRSAGLPVGSASITSIVASADNANKVWVTFSGYNAGNKVFYSQDAGLTWTNISGTLPNLPINCIAYRPNSLSELYIGADVGVFVRDSTMNDWIPYYTNLPNVIVNDIELNNSLQKIRIGTYGRGMWESPLNPLTPIASFTASDTITCLNTPITFSNTSTGSVNSYSWNFGVGASPATATSAGPVNVQYSTSGNKTITLTVGGPSGSNTSTRTNYINVLSVTPTVVVNITTNTGEVICKGAVVTCTATSQNGGAAPFYQWKKNGINVGSNSITYVDASISNTDVVSCVMTSNASCISGSPATSNLLTFTVKVSTPTTISISAAPSGPVCTGTNVVFNATTVNSGPSPSYQWKVDGINSGTNSSSFSSTSLTNGQVVTCNLVATNTCPTSNKLGNSASLNSSTNNVGAAYPTFYGNGRQQYLILASELSALGFIAGKITSLGFSVGSVIGNPATLNGYTIKIGNTASTQMPFSFLSPVFTTVFGPVNFTPSVNTLSAHVFTSPYSWDGISNLVVDLCFSNQVTGTSAYNNSQTSTVFPSTVYYQANGAAGAGACTQSTVTNNGLVRPNMTMTVMVDTVYTSSNSISLAVQQYVVPTVNIGITSGNNPSCPGSSITFTATPANGGTNPDYLWKLNGNNTGTNSNTFATASLINNDVVTCHMTSNNLCISGINPVSSNTITQVVNPNLNATISISVSPANPVCAGSVVSFSASVANEGTFPVYQWKKNGNNVGTSSTTYIDTALVDGDVIICIMTSNAVCVTGNPASSNTISMTVNPVASDITISAAPSGTICSGTNVTFTAVPVNGGANPNYQWKKNGIVVGTNSTSYSDAALGNNDVISCTMTSDAMCTMGNQYFSNEITMMVNPNLTPGIAVSRSPSGTICNGTNVVFTAVASNGGGTPVFHWLKNGITVGSNSTTYSSNSLINGDKIICEMTSSLICTNGSPDVSSTPITMTVDPGTSVTPTITISKFYSGTPCTGTNIRFSSSVTNGGTPSYQWKRNGIVFGSSSSVSAFIPAVNSDVITCEMTSSLLCAFPKPAISNSITVAASPTVTASLSIVASPSNSICNSTNVTFTATPSNGGTTPVYQWKKNGANTGTNSVTYSNATLVNNDLISCMMTSNATCVTGSPATSNSISMSVTPNVIVGISVSKLPAGAICTGTNVTFTATPSNGGNTPSYLWKKNGNVVGTNSATYADSSLLNNDQVSCTLTSNVTCISGSNNSTSTLTMIVNPNLTPSINIIATPADSICNGSAVTFTTTVTNGGSSPVYQWRKNGIITGANNNIYVDSLFNNGDQVNCTMTSNAACALPVTVTSNTLTLNIISCNVTLNLKAYFEGLLITSGMVRVIDPTNYPDLSDSITVELHEELSPYTLVHSVKDVISQPTKSHVSLGSSGKL